MTKGTRPGAARDVSLRVGAKGMDGMVDGRTDVAHEQNQAWQERLHEAGGVGAIALARTRKQAGMIDCGRAHQRGDVVGQNLGRHVGDQGPLRQSRDGFEVQPVLDPFEGFLDSPALVIQVAEHRRQAMFGIDVGGEQANLAVGRDLAHQAQRRRLSGAIPIAHVLGAWRVQRHRAVQRARATNGFGGAPATVVVAAHDEADASRAEQGHQPSRRITTVEYQHVVGIELVERLHEHAALAYAGAVHAGMQGCQS